jgi:hypothetical protein
LLEINQSETRIAYGGTNWAIFIKDLP